MPRFHVEEQADGSFAVRASYPVFIARSRDEAERTAASMSALTGSAGVRPGRTEEGTWYSGGLLPSEREKLEAARRGYDAPKQRERDELWPLYVPEADLPANARERAEAIAKERAEQALAQADHPIVGGSAPPRDA